MQRGNWYSAPASADSIPKTNRTGVGKYIGLVNDNNTNKRPSVGEDSKRPTKKQEYGNFGNF